MAFNAGRDPLWYKDAVIYELHVKTFCDGNGDGIGDFTGLRSRLDYLQDLGVTCLWLLPFCESPLLDDGYDVAHYERVHPAYGTMGDFQGFLEDAHARGLRVITELVVNHTSDQHPWFQASRRAPAGSAKRDFYVWSDTDRKYADARVIFGDSEASNWTWDPVAGQFYWHRFFWHQPDLNFDNAQVRLAVLKVMRFWLDLGVDGLRLDAIAHLFERDGTSCDNLPETHAFLTDVRADIEARHSGRVLLAEVNQTPAVTREYFGRGDECHMAFHFPLMPRLFQALAEEDGRPIAEAVQQTADIPAACQWALFLRNHDELTLSALLPDDRESLLARYAPLPRMRLNRGIRRRLAPLLDNDAARIELATALILSLPGTPIVYYGDEIGMGDDIQLPDRDGVRTPMQWTAEAHAGFTLPGATPVLPPIDDAIYGFRTVNVAAQQRDPSSLLSTVRRLLRLRKAHPAFGRGAIEFLPTGNRHVLAFTRHFGSDAVLVLVNLATTVQDVTVRTRCEWGGDDLVNGVPIDGGRAAGRAALPPSAVCWWPAPRALDSERRAETRIEGGRTAQQKG